MVHSMTGYGEAEVEYEGKQIRISVKSLNSKSFNFRLHAPDYYLSKEVDLRKQTADTLERGRVDVYIDVSYTEQSAPDLVNKPLFFSYYDQLKDLAHSVDSSEDQLLELTLQMPEVIHQEEDQLDEGEWQQVQKGLQKAHQQLLEFRQKEGETIQQTLENQLKTIRVAHQKVKEKAPQRKQQVREKLQKNLDELIGEDEIDEDRLEEELVYYVDKMDITEESDRLKAHLDHFEETLHAEAHTGKKLDFIAQEIHREINTMGAKANDSDIQQQVVQMKEALAKIREQVFNVV